MIQVNKIPTQTVELFSPDGTRLGHINEYELNDIKIQICECDAEGYHIVFEGEKIQINKNGELERWPTGLFDMNLFQFHTLIETRKAKR